MRTWLLAAVMTAVAVGAVFGAPPDMGIGDVRVVEGDTGTRSVEVTVSMSMPAPGPVTVSYATKDGTGLGGSDYRAANGTLAFAVGELTKKITLSIVGDTAVEADETFDVVLSNASGATLADSTGTATIVNDDYAGAPRRSVYEVRLTFAGYTGSFAGADCPGVRRNGSAVLTGLVAGDESVASDDDIEYEGVLQMDTNVDLCEVTRRAGSSEDMFCAITVVGSGPLNAQLSVYADDRGGYIKAKKAPGTFVANVSGTCDQAAIREERSSFPDNSMANVFDGNELPLPSGPLRVGRYTDGDLTLDVLRVVRSVPRRP
jgi:hypothetical protein